MSHSTSVAADLGAGYLAGTLSVFVGHPFDTLKTLLQTGHKPITGGSHNRLALMYKGISSPLTVVPLVMATTFAANEWSKRELMANPRWQHYPGQVALVAGAIAGALPTVFTTASVFFKVQLQVSHEPISLFRFVRTSLRSHGMPWLMRIYWNYWPLHVTQEAVGRAIWFATYDLCKSRLTDPTDPQAFLPRLVAGAASGALGWTAIYPLDTIRAVCFANPTVSVRQAARAVWARSGVRGFWRGYFLTITRTVPVAATQLATYDYMHPVLCTALGVTETRVAV